LWCYALENRREIIKRPPDKYLATMAGLKHHSIKTYLEHMVNLGLTYMTDEYIQMIGLQKKHSKFIFKTPYMECLGGATGNQELNSTQLNSTEPKSTPKKKLRTTPIEPKKFQEFWNEYPRKIGKGDAATKWNARLNAKDSDPEQMILCAKNYAEQCVKEGRESKHIKHPATFLSDTLPFLDHLEKPKGDPNPGNNGKAKLFD
jgi:hypothetical protein